MRGVVIDCDDQMAFDIKDEADVTIEGVRLRNGKATSSTRGGYFRQDSTGTLTIRDSYLGPTGLAVGGGGQIQSHDGDLVIEGSTLDGGRATTTGGCLSTSGDALSITDAYFVGCDGATGGGAYIGDVLGTASIAYSAFESNVSSTHGGAIHATLLPFTSNMREPSLRVKVTVPGTSASIVRVTSSKSSASTGYVPGRSRMVLPGGAELMWARSVEVEVAKTSAACAVPTRASVTSMGTSGRRIPPCPADVSPALRRCAR